MPLARTAVLAAIALLGVVPASRADHGPTRPAGSTCNGSPAFNYGNIATRAIPDAVRAQNPDAVRPDGSLDFAAVRHAHLTFSGHLAVQVVATPGVETARAVIEVQGTDESWRPDSTSHPAYVVGADGFETPARAIDSDNVMNGTFAFFPATDIFPDGNYVVRLRAFAPDGTELGRVCTDVTLRNSLDHERAFRANTDAGYEPPTNREPGEGIPTQPVVWFPASEPHASQRADYRPAEARIEFSNPLESVRVETAHPVSGAWRDVTAFLVRDDFRRTHSITGRALDDAGFKEVPLATNRKVLGPGFRLDLEAIGAGDPAPLRVSALDVAGRAWCGIHRPSANAAGAPVFDTGPAPCAIPYQGGKRR